MAEILDLISHVFGSEVSENALNTFKQNEEFFRRKAEKEHTLLGLDAANLRLLREAYVSHHEGELSDEELAVVQTICGVLILLKEENSENKSKYTQQFRELSLELHRAGFPLSILFDKLLLFM